MWWQSELRFNQHDREFSRLRSAVHTKWSRFDNTVIPTPHEVHHSHRSMTRLTSGGNGENHEESERDREKELLFCLMRRHAFRKRGEKSASECVIHIYTCIISSLSLFLLFWYTYKIHNPIPSPPLFIQVYHEPTSNPNGSTIGWWVNLEFVHHYQSQPTHLIVSNESQMDIDGKVVKPCALMQEPEPETQPSLSALSSPVCNMYQITPTRGYY